MKHALLVCAMLFLSAAAGSAQTLAREPDVSSARLRFGPLFLNPTIALTNAGVDDDPEAAGRLRALAKQHALPTASIAVGPFVSFKRQ